MVAEFKNRGIVPLQGDLFMPRYSTTFSGDKPVAQKRQFPRPWSLKPRETGFALVDANGIETAFFGFVPAEMREHFPDGKTMEEARWLASYMLKMVNDSSTAKAAPEPNPPMKSNRQFFKGAPGLHRGYARDGFR